MFSFWSFFRVENGSVRSVKKKLFPIFFLIDGPVIKSWSVDLPELTILQILILTGIIYPSRECDVF